MIFQKCRSHAKLLSALQLNQMFFTPTLICPGIFLGIFMTTIAAFSSPSNYDLQVGSLLAQMTLDEKIGQMVQPDLNAVTNHADIQKYGFGSMLSGGDSKPAG